MTNYSYPITNFIVEYMKDKFGFKYKDGEFWSTCPSCHKEVEVYIGDFPEGDKCAECRDCATNMDWFAAKEEYLEFFEAQSKYFQEKMRQAQEEMMVVRRCTTPPTNRCETACKHNEKAIQHLNDCVGLHKIEELFKSPKEQREEDAITPDKTVKFIPFENIRYISPDEDIDNIQDAKARELIQNEFVKKPNHLLFWAEYPIPDELGDLRIRNHLIFTSGILPKEHHVEDAKGRVIYCDGKYIIGSIDEGAYPHLCRGIREGYVKDGLHTEIILIHRINTKPRIV